MGKVKDKALKDGWKEFALTKEEMDFVNSMLNSQQVVHNNYEELIGRFLGASVAPRVGMPPGVQFELDPTDPSRKVRMRPAPPTPEIEN